MIETVCFIRIRHNYFYGATLAQSDTASHSPFEADLAFDSVFFSDTRNRFEHWLWPAGVDNAFPAWWGIVYYPFFHCLGNKAFCPCRAVICSNYRFCSRGIELGNRITGLGSNHFAVDIEIRQFGYRFCPDKSDFFDVGVIFLNVFPRDAESAEPPSLRRQVEHVFCFLG